MNARDQIVQDLLWQTPFSWAQVSETLYRTQDGFLIDIAPDRVKTSVILVSFVHQGPRDIIAHLHAQPDQDLLTTISNACSIHTQHALQAIEREMVCAVLNAGAPGGFYHFTERQLLGPTQGVAIDFDLSERFQNLRRYACRHFPKTPQMNDSFEILHVPQFFVPTSSHERLSYLRAA